MIFDLTPAPAVDWSVLRVEWACARQAVHDEIDSRGYPRPETLKCWREIEARGEALLTIQLARIRTE